MTSHRGVAILLLGCFGLLATNAVEANTCALAAKVRCERDILLGKVHSPPICKENQQVGVARRHIRLHGFERSNFRHHRTY